MSNFKEIKGGFDIDIPTFGIRMKGDLQAIKKFEVESIKTTGFKNESFNPDKRIDVSEIKNEDTIENKRFDPDERIAIDKEKNEFSVKLEQFNPDERIQINDMSSENLTDKEENIEYVKCINEKLEGQCHDETGIPFEKRIIELEDKKIEGIFPKFESMFDAQLSKEMLTSKDRVQFKECNAQLKNAMENNMELYEKFTEEQREQIMNGDTPDGYVWHHDAEAGKLQLVDFETHSKTNHTGGRFIWGGGGKCR